MPSRKKRKRVLKAAPLVTMLIDFNPATETVGLQFRRLGTTPLVLSMSLSLSPLAYNLMRKMLPTGVFQAVPFCPPIEVTPEVCWDKVMAAQVNAALGVIDGRGRTKGN